jgi:hypothetical protein
MKKRKARKPNFRLSWSSYDLYTKCPRQWAFRYGWKPAGLDPVDPGERSMHHAFYGSVVAECSDLFFKNRMWEKSSVQKDCIDLVNKVYEDLRPRFPIMFTKDQWDGYPENADDALNLCMTSFMSFVTHTVPEYFVNVTCLTEVKLEATLRDPTNRFEGGIPFIAIPDVVASKDGKLEILDGKNSKNMANKSKDQLLLYAIMVEAVFGRKPDRIGYIPYKYPASSPPTRKSNIHKGFDFGPYSYDGLEPVHGNVLRLDPDKWTGVYSWPYDETESKRLLSSIATMYNSVHKSTSLDSFVPLPKVGKCKFCDYSEKCKAFKTFSENREADKLLKKKAKRQEKKDKPLSNKIAIIF